MIQELRGSINVSGPKRLEVGSKISVNYLPFFCPLVPSKAKNGVRNQPRWLTGFLVYAVFYSCFLGCWSLCFGSPRAIGAPGQQEGSQLAANPSLEQEEILGGWLSLFDGNTLFGWKAVTEANWRVEEGEIRVDSGERGLLRTTAQFDDYELVLEFKASEQTNSGVFLRTNPDPRNVNRDCYELNIVSRRDHQFPTGSLVNRAACELDFAADRWHQIRVLADGALIKVWIDDTKTVAYMDPQPLGRGFLGLQFNSGPVAFRNIRLKPINVPLIKIDKHLEEWNTDQKLASEFAVSDEGVLQLTGGKGQIETRARFGDFVFSMLCRTNARGLNSGVFFRCIPGELMNGYESQIQNQFQNEDRSQPVDCGTGGIFRRSVARYVNANDNEWFSKTIVATGPHISVWVNGYQVTDWSDQRPPDENPRRGRRLEKGTIIFQGHDPTTDILFKNLRARELSRRGK